MLWNYRLIAQNPFTTDYVDTLLYLTRQHMAAFRIQLYWRKCTTNHVYTLCHKLQLHRILA
jgi:hypothetical protein